LDVAARESGLSASIDERGKFRKKRMTLGEGGLALRRMAILRRSYVRNT
jgi:hypothetical protein